ncbi:hypothetical protein [Eikenella corrodens]|uniref:hypothetical protein n=1 Tax=Eikenella corrodens TaxID=539 RepID=UPI0028E6F847|nr:hypothetical protein [Eikenella corrodens]
MTANLFGTGKGMLSGSLLHEPRLPESTQLPQSENIFSKFSGSLIADLKKAT